MNFTHGGDIKGFALDLGCTQEEVVDLSSNINFIKPKNKIDFNALDISSYPDYEELYKSIAALYDVDTRQIELFNGGSSAIFSLFRHFKTKDVSIYSPAYLEYKKAAVTFGYKIELINRFTDMNRPVKEGSLVVFVNPSTPEGTFYKIDTLMKQWIEKKCTILIDESFLDFTPYPSALKYLQSYDDIYILKSMTKFYSSAGIRVGAVISSKENIQELKQTQPLWKISQFDSHYIQEMLKDEEFTDISKTLNTLNKEYLIKILQEFRYTQQVFDSSANFVLLQLKGMDAQTFQELLKPYRIMVRDCSNFDFLDKSYVRIAVKSTDDLEKLAIGLQNIVL